jgi:hypothetical protein
MSYNDRYRHQPCLNFNAHCSSTESSHYHICLLSLEVEVAMMTEIEEETIASAGSLQVVAEKDLVQETAIQVGVQKPENITHSHSSPIIGCTPRTVLRVI